MSSAKRPLEDPSSPSAPTDLPEAKRPALDKVVREETAAEGFQSTDGAVAESTKPAEEHGLPAPVTNGAADSHIEVPAPPAPNGGATLPPADALPLPSTTSQSDRATSQAPSTTPQDESSWIHIRAVISSAEAATCIGKGGENVTQIRRLSGAKCTVSDYSRGAVERILTVSGAQDAVAKVSSGSVLHVDYADRTRPLVSSFVL